MHRTIVCLCGSTKFKQAFEEANKRETLKGNIVLSVGWCGHSEPVPIAPEEKLKLDELHFDKIRMSDEVLFLNVDGYLGYSSLRELELCCKRETYARFLEPDNLCEKTVSILKKYNYSTKSIVLTEETRH